MDNCGRQVRVYKYAYIGNSIHKPYSTIMVPAHYTRCCSQIPNSSKYKKPQTLNTSPLPVKKKTAETQRPNNWHFINRKMIAPIIIIIGARNAYSGLWVYIYMCVVHHVFITYFVQISKADTKKSDWLRPFPRKKTHFTPRSINSLTNAPTNIPQPASQNLNIGAWGEDRHPPPFPPHPQV